MAEAIVPQPPRAIPWWCSRPGCGAGRHRPRAGPYLPVGWLQVRLALNAEGRLHVTNYCSAACLTAAAADAALRRHFVADGRDPSTPAVRAEKAARRARWAATGRGHPPPVTGARAGADAGGDGDA